MSGSVSPPDGDPDTVGSPAARRPVLVPGATGNVGRYVVRDLVAAGHDVVATDLRTRANERAARRLPSGVPVRWADLTDRTAATRLVTEVQPRALLHLAAVIPPTTYRNLTLARKVNVGAVETLLDAVTGLPSPCRLVLASSVAVYGPRNPHRVQGPVTAETPTRPREAYGAHKVEAERLVRAAAVDWTILRLGVVVFPDMGLAVDADAMRLESLLPTDGRLHAVDARDVAQAFVAAVDAPCAGRTLLVAGDRSTRMTQRGLADSVTRAVGLANALPQGRPGDPADDDTWFNVDWMDTTEAEDLLGFQRHGWSSTLEGVARSVGPLRRVLPLVAPVARLVLARRSAGRSAPPGPARPWDGIAELWGEDALVEPSVEG